MDISHPLYKEVVGLGNKLMISNLSMDGAYKMTVFEKAGFHSLIAVPITTYKVLGIMGAADRKKGRFNNDFTQLFALVANLVGVTLSKNTKAQLPVFKEDSLPVIDNLDSTKKRSSKKETKLMIDNRISNDYDESPDNRLDTFHRHDRKMDHFRQSHK